eukprot:g29430.t1
MGRVADKVAAMEPTSPEVIRAVTACHALRCGRGISRHEYRKSFPTTQIKQFWSHSWQGGWRSKITTKCSNSLLVLWDPSYTRRLWCIFELAAFLHTRPTGKKFKLLVRPLILGPCSVLLTLTMVVVVIAIGWVPQRDGLAGSEALWGGQVLVLFIGLWAMISVSRRYFRAVEQLRNECLVSESFRTKMERMGSNCGGQSRNM